MEPTGRCRRPARIRLSAASLPVTRANPDRARQIAWAAGRRAMADAADAKLLAEPGQVKMPKIVVPTSPGWTTREDRVIAMGRRQLMRRRIAHP